MHLGKSNNYYFAYQLRRSLLKNTHGITGSCFVSLIYWVSVNDGKIKMKNFIFCQHVVMSEKGCLYIFSQYTKVLNR